MNYYAMTDNTILSEIGARIVAHRLRKNITQEEVAQSIGVGRMTYNQLENGKGKLSTLVATLRYLDCLDSLDAFLTMPEFSPIAARKLKGKEKKRASARSSKLVTTQEDW